MCECVHTRTAPVLHEPYLELVKELTVRNDTDSCMWGFNKLDRMNAAKANAMTSACARIC